MNFVDTHVHLHFPDYDADREQVIKRSRQAGVQLFINVGTDVESSCQSVQLAQKHPFVYAAAGIHPHDAKDVHDDDFPQIERLLHESKVVAIGEVGLDFFRNLSTPEIQKKVLNRFLDLYRKTKKPLILHIRNAYKEMKEQIQSELGSDAQGIVHCFSSDKETMREFLDLGFYISFAGPLTYKKNDTLREAFRACPLDRVLLETDAPFLSPQSQRGKRNESGFMVETASVGAEVKKISLEELSIHTTTNAERVFRL